MKIFKKKIIFYGLILFAVLLCGLFLYIIQYTGGPLNRYARTTKKSGDNFLSSAKCVCCLECHNIATNLPIDIGPEAKCGEIGKLSEKCEIYFKNNPKTMSECADCLVKNNTSASAEIDVSQTSDNNNLTCQDDSDCKWGCGCFNKDYLKSLGSRVDDVDCETPPYEPACVCIVNECNINTGLIAQTDQKEYGQGEKVVLTIENKLKEKLATLYGITVEEGYGIKSGQVRFDIECPCGAKCSKVPPVGFKNGKLEFTWDQKDNACNQVSGGTYRFKFTWRITGDPDEKTLLQTSYSNEFEIKNKELCDDLKTCEKDSDCIGNCADFSCNNRALENDCDFKPECVCRNNICAKSEINGERCKEFEAKVDELLVDAASCNSDSDCIVDTENHLGCPFGCYLIRNKSFDVLLIKDTVNEYKNKCAVCKYKCPVAPEQKDIICKDNKCVDDRFTSLAKNEQQKIEFAFNTYVFAEEKCDINLANSQITKESKDVMHYTCDNMADESKCYKNKEFQIFDNGNNAILYFSPFNHKTGWPFFFAKEDGEWKIDFKKMASDIAMGGGGCDTGWGWKNLEIKEEFCDYFLAGGCPENN